MATLEWDEGLADRAQKWTNQCIDDHGGADDVGQNFAQVISTDDGNKIESMIQSWYDEVASFNKNNAKSFAVSPYEEKPVGHYTQMVWAASTKIGCGFIKITKDEKILDTLVCDYSKSGNYEGEAVY